MDAAESADRGHDALTEHSTGQSAKAEAAVDVQIESEDERSTSVELEQCGEDVGGAIEVKEEAPTAVEEPDSVVSADLESDFTSVLPEHEVTPPDHLSVSSVSADRSLSEQENGDEFVNGGENAVERERSSSNASVSEQVDVNDELTSQCSSSSNGTPQFELKEECINLQLSKSEQVSDHENDHQHEEVSLLDPGGTSTLHDLTNSDGVKTLPSIGESLDRSPESGDRNASGGYVNSDELQTYTTVEDRKDTSGRLVVEHHVPIPKNLISGSPSPSGQSMDSRHFEAVTKYGIETLASLQNQRYNQSLPRRVEIYDQNGSFFQSQQHASNFGNSLYPQGNYPNLAKVLPKTSPELMHLIDSAIQETDLSSLQRLQRVVAGKGPLPQARKASEENVAGVVVDVLLAKMGIDSSQKDNQGSPPKIMLSAGAAFVAGKLLPWLPCQGYYPVPLSPRTRMAKGLALVLQSCTRNRAMCSAAGLLQVLLETVRDIIASDEKLDKSWDSSPLLDALEALGSHSLTVMDLRDWLNTVVVAIPTGKAADLISSLERAMLGEETRGPSFTFEFDGESSGLLGPAESRWPFMNGYAVATWLFIESFADTVNTAAAAAAIAAAAAAKSGKSSAVSAAAAASALAGEGMAHMPRLFSFLSADNHGVEAYFHGQFLVVETVNGKGKKASMHFTHAFKPRQWYFVGLEHTYKQSLLGKTDSEVRLYVDGQLYEARPLEYPRVSKALGFCCIGTNPPPAMAGLQRRRRQCPLFAEMGPVYIFKEPIGPDRISRLAARGGDALPAFGNGAGVPWFANSEQAFAAAADSATLDIELGSRLHLLYHPKLLTGRLCPDASPSGASGLHRKPAEVLGHVHVAARTRPSEALWAMGEGGPLALLPLAVAVVDKDTLLPLLGDMEVSAAVALLSAPIFRILSVAFQHPGNAEEMAKSYAPRLLAYLLGHLVSVPALGDPRFKGIDQTRNEERDEELVAAVVSLAQAPKNNVSLKVQLYSTLLLDLKLWYRCAYGLQKKLLSTLADLAFTDASTMRSSNAVQLLLDGCRRCYWVLPEPDSLHLYAGGRSSRPVGEMNALVDELLVVVELLVGSTPFLISETDVSSLVQFVMDCPQPNQVARVLHLIYRLVVQPNSSRASLFAETLLSSGVVEMLFLLLKREADLDETAPAVLSGAGNVYSLKSGLESHTANMGSGELDNDKIGSEELSSFDDGAAKLFSAQSVVVSHSLSSATSGKSMDVTSAEALAEISRTWLPSLRLDVPGERKYAGRNLGGISLSISADSASSNFRNVDSGDGIMVGVVSLVGALVAGGFLKLVSFSSAATLVSGNSSSGAVSSVEVGLGIAIGIGTWMMYALRNAFRTASRRLLTDNVYSVILSAVVRLEMGSSASRDRLSLYDSGHRFEHIDLLLVLLQSLPFASPTLQHRALQDILFLSCTHPENRMILTTMPEWPEWLLEVLISNYEVVPVTGDDGLIAMRDVEDIAYSFVTIMLEYSMRLKDGWKDIEAMVHCAEWLAMIGGSSIGEQRLRREESLPTIKRRLLGGLLDFAARELQLQKMVVATAAAGVAAEGLSPQAAKAEAETVAQLSLSLAENSLVVLMLVEDHLRLQCQVHGAKLSTDPISPRVLGRLSGQGVGLDLNENQILKRVSSGNFMLDLSSRRFSGIEPSGVSLDMLASMADANGHISAVAMERLTASTAAEPYEAVRGAFVSYGTCGSELAEGWKQRSRMWYGVGIPIPGSAFGGGGRGWDDWRTAVERDEHGQWVDLSLVRKSIAMLQSLLLDDSGPGGGGVGFGGGAGTAFGGAHALQQLLDSDQIFFAMLRMVLLSMREEDVGNDEEDMTGQRALANELVRQVSRFDPSLPSETLSVLTMRKAKTSLLWCVLAPLITMGLSEARRQRVLVTVCILYSEVWHAVSKERIVLRKHYVEAIIPPFTALLRKWRPLLSGIHEFTDADGQSPLAVEDRALALDALPLEAAVSMISPAWAAAFASPPAAMALAMAAAGVGGGEASNPRAMFANRDLSRAEQKSFRLRSFPKLPDSPRPCPPKDKASAKAAAVVAARDQERNAKIGSGRGLGAIAMATSTQRRNLGDKERAKRWNLMESMNTAWEECSFITADIALELTGKDIPKLQKILSAMVDTASTLRSAEVKRRALSAAADEYSSAVGAHSWRSLIRRLLEIGALFGRLEHQIGDPERIFYKLDPLESSMRMRRRLKRNYKGTDHYGAAADFQGPYEVGLIAHVSKNMETDGEFTSTILPSGTPKLIPESNVLDDAADSFTRNSVGEREDRKDDKEELQIGSDNIMNEPTEMPLLRETVQSSVAVAPNSSLVAAAAPIVTEPKEKLLLDIPGAMVQPLKVLRGRFQVTTRRICFMIDDRVHVDESGIASLQRNEDTQSSPQQIPKDNPVGRSQRNEGAKDRIWPLSVLWEIHSRRYLLRRSALELFMVDRSNFFFNFGTEDNRRAVYKALVQARPPHLNHIYAGTQRPERLLKRTQLMERWARHEISNFEYLMQLNTLAGRSFNDLTQYPIFPWILADYTSKELNLEDPNVFRDLSKPVGALNSDRLEKFLERYYNFDDPVIPKFHYGSHYSSAGTVLYYLVRMEPYSTLAITLQGGKFDHADRMFSDIPSTWNGVLEDMSDVKELVPELFYMPEILINTNELHLGKTQNGETLGHVKLPPWAQDPVDFVHKHRLALESEYVSANLHSWIDLIFGYKQRGKEAVAANNVFFYMTYEGAVDIDKITDPVLRKATQDQITYFGQTPSQLLTTPHMKRLPLDEALHLQTMFLNPKATKIYVIPSPERLNVPAAKLCVTRESIVTVGMDAPACQIAQHRWQPNTPDGRGSPFVLQHGRSTSRARSGAFIRMFGGQSTPSGDDTGYPRAIALTAPGVQPGMIVVVTPDGRHLLTGGHADNTLKVVATENARVVESASGHYGPITCLASSSDGSILVTGSQDATAIIWRIHGNTGSAVSGSNSVSDPTVVTAASTAGSATADSSDTGSGIDGRRRRIEGPLHVLRGHVDELICCSVNTDLDLVVTSSVSRGVLLHSISRGRFLRKLLIDRADIISVSSEGNIIVWNKVQRILLAFTINGIFIAKKEFLDGEGNITSMLVSSDGLHLVFSTSHAKPFDPDNIWRGKTDEADRQQMPVPLCPICRYDSTLCEHSGAHHKPSSVIQRSRSYQGVGVADQTPTISFVKLYTLKVVHQFCLQDGQEVTAMTLNDDNTNLVVSTANGQLLIFTDPALSVKVVDQMLRLGWEGGGLSGFLN